MPGEEAVTAAMSTTPGLAYLFAAPEVERMLRRRGLLLAADRIGYALQANWIDTVWSIRGGSHLLRSVIYQ